MALLAAAASKEAFSAARQTSASVLEGSICPPTVRNASFVALIATPARIHASACGAARVSNWTARRDA